MIRQGYQETGIDNELSKRAIRTYLEALAIGEPIRLRLWDSRGLTTTQLRLIFILRQGDGVSISSLAQSMGLSPSAMTGIIDRLVEQGLVSRQENPEDRRIVELRATDRGKTLLTNLWERRVGHMSEVLAQLSSEELSTLARGLTSLVKVMETYQGERENEHN